jgi:Redoxin
VARSNQRRQQSIHYFLSAPLRLCVSIALLCAFATGAGCSGNAPPRPLATVESSRRSPIDETPLVGVSGEHIMTLGADPSMKAMALIFVLPDCPICNAYVPELNRLHEAFRPRGVGLFIVHVDPDITAERAKAHAEEYELRPPVALDPRHEWVKRAGATIAPQAAAFSSAGQIVYLGRINDQYVGPGKRRANVTSHDLRDALDAVLAGQPVANARTEAVGCPIPNISSGE